MGTLPEEVLALRKSAEHVVNLQEKMIVSLPPVSSAKMQKLDREKTVINLYVAGHPIDEVWRASGFRSRSSVFRILNKHGIKLNRGNLRYSASSPCIFKTTFTGHPFYSFRTLSGSVLLFPLLVGISLTDTPPNPKIKVTGLS